MASLIGWLIVGILGAGTAVGVVGIAVSAVTLAFRWLVGLRAAGPSALALAPESVPARESVPAA